MRVLVTGSAGFIGYHMAARLIASGHEVVGLDGMTPYYDPALKRARRAKLEASKAFRSEEFLLEDQTKLERLYATGFDAVYHFAAQAGVRYSLENPRAYVDANLIGTYNLLEVMRQAPPQACASRLDLLRLWRQPLHPLPRDRSRRSLADVVCRDEEGDGRNGACL